MTERERDVRAAVYGALRDTGKAPAADQLAVTLGLARDDVVDALRGLAAAHALVLRPDGASIWMAHPFSGVPTDFLVTVGARRWFANCVWDGLAVIGILGGTGRLDTHSPATEDPVSLQVIDGTVQGEAIAHFLVPASRFWDDIGYT
jgi:hypothetical protein